ncbi:hypothetical protein JTE90_014660 [Oedothorax gibbosus]|uniref:Uncharacterized protein n=1 Tax=Oedothorax gibbosus TaxID=931172 RepID=A0AAV6V871_9ARAC|nr:hypothetical protein JTE90_014660 [Oedothorax gibbosus]
MRLMKSLLIQCSKCCHPLMFDDRNCVVVDELCVSHSLIQTSEMGTNILQPPPSPVISLQGPIVTPCVTE